MFLCLKAVNLPIKLGVTQVHFPLDALSVENQLHGLGLGYRCHYLVYGLWMFLALKQCPSNTRVKEKSNYSHISDVKMEMDPLRMLHQACVICRA